VGERLYKYLSEEIRALYSLYPFPVARHCIYFFKFTCPQPVTPEAYPELIIIHIYSITADKVFFFINLLYKILFDQCRKDLPLLGVYLCTANKLATEKNKFTI